MATSEKGSRGGATVVVVLCFYGAASSSEFMSLMYDGIRAEGVEETIWVERG